MKVVVDRESVQTMLWWTQRLLFTAAALTLGYCVFVVGDSEIFQYTESRRLDAVLASQSAPRNNLRRMTSYASVFPSLPARGLVGRIEIDRLGLSVIVMEGTSTSTLRRAAGHISGTAIPGHEGNIGISAHRDTFFRPLKDVRADDLITFTTLSGQFRYRVVTTRIVSRFQVDVLRNSPDEILTLVTCYPFYFVGAAPDRFIVTAKRVGNNS